MTGQQAPGARDEPRVCAAPVVVVGSVNRDYVTFVEHLPAPGETVLALDLVIGTGGKGSNQAVAAARAGATAVMVGCVGEDDDGACVVRDLSQAGLDVEQVMSLPGEHTGRAHVAVAADGENFIVVVPGANLALSPDRAVEALGRVTVPGGVVVVQAEISASTVEAVLVAGAAAGARVVLNLAPFTPLAARALELCDPLVVNEAEVSQMVGQPVDTLVEARDAALRVDRRCRSVVVTLGAAGAVVAENGTVTHVPAPEVTVVDTTGAGDALAGALAARLAAGDRLIQAVEWGVHAASLSVGAVGAQVSYPEAAAVLALVAETHRRVPASGNRGGP
jgi:ribokinase